MNPTLNSYALVLCCAAMLSTGCGAKDATPDASTPAATDATEQPIHTEGFETGEAVTDPSKSDSNDDADGTNS